MIDVDQHRWLFDAVLHQVDQIGAACQKFRARIFRDGLERGFRLLGPLISEWIHPRPSWFAPLPRQTLSTAAMIPGYAPQRQMFPLMRSRISAGVNSAAPGAQISAVTQLDSPARASSSIAMAEQICPGVQ